jgi:hypothetical protein
MANWKREPPDAGSDPFAVRIVMGPGLVRRGVLLNEEEGLLSAAFRSDEPHYLTIGSHVTLGSDERPRPVVVVRREERRNDRVYGFRDEGRNAAAEPSHRGGAPFVRRLELSFGNLSRLVTSLWIAKPNLGVAVSLADEALLAAADLVELRVTAASAVHSAPPIRGWIRVRELAARHVAYSLECTRALSDHFDAEWQTLAGTSATAERSHDES